MSRTTCVSGHSAEATSLMVVSSHAPFRCHLSVELIRWGHKDHQEIDPSNFAGIAAH